MFSVLFIILLLVQDEWTVQLFHSYQLDKFIVNFKGVG